MYPTSLFMYGLTLFLFIQSCSKHTVSLEAKGSNCTCKCLVVKPFVSQLTIWSQLIDIHALNGEIGNNMLTEADNNRYQLLDMNGLMIF